MAREIQIAHGYTGRTLYASIANVTSGFFWNQSGGTSGAFEAFTSGNWARYAVSLTELGVTGRYHGNFPSVVGAGVYGVEARNQAGADPAQTDGTVGSETFQWDGSVVVPQANLATSGQIGQLAPMRIARGVALSGFPFKMVSAADHVTPFTSGVVSGQISRNGGSFGALQSGTITETGLGWFRCNLTSGDLAGDTVALVFTAVGISGGSADQRDFALITQRVSGVN